MSQSSEDGIKQPKATMIKFLSRDLRLVKKREKKDDDNDKYKNK